MGEKEGGGGSEVALSDDVLHMYILYNILKVIRQRNVVAPYLWPVGVTRVKFRFPDSLLDERKMGNYGNFSGFRFSVLGGFRNLRFISAMYASRFSATLFREMQFHRTPASTFMGIRGFFFSKTFRRSAQRPQEEDTLGRRSC